MQQSLREKVIGVSYWIELTARRGQDPIKSKPNFLKVLSDSIAEKRLQKEVQEIEMKRNEEYSKNKAAANQRKKRTQGKRRRSSYLIQYLIGDGTAEGGGGGEGAGGGGGGGGGGTHLPTKARARRSSVTLLKPSLLKEKQLKPKFFKSNQVQPNFDDLAHTKKGVGQQSSNVSDLVQGGAGHSPINASTRDDEGDKVIQLPLSVNVTELAHENDSHVTSQSQKHRSQKENEPSANGSSSNKGKSQKSRVSRGESLESGSPTKKASSGGSPAVKPSKSRLPRDESSESPSSKVSKKK
jgi:hypothetical protein